MRAWDLPIARNPLRTREDLVLSLEQLLAPLEGRFVREGAGLHLGNSSAHYDEAAALLEGECRLLWGLVPLAVGGGDSRFFDYLRRGLVAGTDPANLGYWAVGGDRDQRFVEMAAIALALLLAPGEFWTALSEADRLRLAAWLFTINRVELPPTNWEFFRVFVNIALRRLGMPYDAARLEESFAAIEALYRRDGWYLDETNYDLYNPFAFHYYGLVYATLFAAEDPHRSAHYRERAKLFAHQYLPWFASDGSSLPFGRSLGYRFAATSFFSALAFAGEASLGWGVLKGLVLRNLRSWFARPIFDRDGILTIGYAYPSLLVAEQYNSPGSPYWALKTYLVLALPGDHPFWMAEEEPLPPLPERSHLETPHLLFCRVEGAGPGASRESSKAEVMGEHVYALNAGQYPCYESENAAAKYAKFAYSNRFGFCVSHSSYDLSKTGCDSSLLLSEGDGYWRERRESEDRYSCEDYVASTWLPWPDVRIRTWLLPFGPWHLRIHAIESARRLVGAEGGFSLPDGNSFEALPRPNVAIGQGSIFASFPWAAGGIRELLALGAAETRRAELHKPEPNLNLLYPKVFIPLLRGELGPGKALLCSAAFAQTKASMPGAAKEGTSHVDGWKCPPLVSYDPETGFTEARHGGGLVRIETGFVGLSGKEWRG